MAEVTLKFAGVNNVLPPDILGAFEDARVPLLRYQTRVQNIDIGNAQEASVRQGYVLAVAGVPHSGWAYEGSSTALFVEDSVLKQFDGTSTADLLTLSTNDTAVFAQVNSVVAFTNGTDIGFIDSTGAHLFQEAPDQFKHKMPAGQALAFHNGCLWVAAGSVVYKSDAFNIEQYDERTAHVPFPAEVSMLQSVKDETGGGLWVSYKGCTAFLAKGDESFRDIAPYTAIAGTAVPGKAEWLGDVGLTGNIVMWRSDRGVCAGDAGGRFVNLSEGRVAMKPGTAGASMLRQAGGAVHFVSAVRSPSTEYNIYS